MSDSAATILAGALQSQVRRVGELEAEVKRLEAEVVGWRDAYKLLKEGTF